MKVEIQTFEKGKKPQKWQEKQTRGAFLSQLQRLSKGDFAMKIIKAVHYLNAAVSVDAYYMEGGKRVEVKIEATRQESNKKRKAVCHG